GSLRRTPGRLPGEQSGRGWGTGPTGQRGSGNPHRGSPPPSPSPRFAPARGGGRISAGRGRPVASARPPALPGRRGAPRTPAAGVRPGPLGFSPRSAGAPPPMRCTTVSGETDGSSPAIPSSPSAAVRGSLRRYYTPMHPNTRSASALELTGDGLTLDDAERV